MDDSTVETGERGVLLWPVAAAFVFAATGMLTFELVQGWASLELELWQSLTITILFSSLVAAYAASRAMSIQRSVNLRILRALAGRARSQAEQAVLKERTEELEREVAERQRAEREARASEARLRLVARQVPGVLWSTDAALRFTGTSGSDLGMLGLQPERVMGRSIAEYFGSEDGALDAVQAVTRALNGVSVRFETTRDGRAFEWCVEPLRDAADVVTGTIGFALDITERKIIQERLTHQAFHDSLTGLANRALFLDRVAHAVERVGRGEHSALVYIDLDDFKAINDRLGHTEGDQMLKIVAERLRGATRGSDTVARLGGDEFAVLLEGIKREPDVLTAVTRMGSSIRRPMALQGDTVEATCSIGIARIEESESVQELLRNADLAMYRAKQSGKGRHAIYHPSLRSPSGIRLPE